MDNEKISKFEDQSYLEFLNSVKEEIRISQIIAIRSITAELLKLYWKIGREILIRQQRQTWGSKVLTRLSQDLKREFPEMKGFSVTNLKQMRSFADAWPDFLEIGQDILTNLPWGHNLVLISKIKERERRLWYANKSVENSWSNSSLIRAIESELYESQKGVSNFELTLPKPQSDLARDLIRDPYYLDFLATEENIEERDIKRLLIAHMREFLLTLGVGFSFVGHNYCVTVGSQDYYIDMLFYHLRLRCFVVIQLEMGAFKPEQSGQMNFYLSAVDNQERQEQDQQTIGIILCSSKENIVVEYSLRNLSNPIAVAEHRIPNMLPSRERLQSELENAMRRFSGY
ncbi:MAG: PDDEXK nuclease domain-containing protein [Cyanobacteria bacterium J06639_14]